MPCVVVIILFFSGDDQPKGKDILRSKYQQKDSLSPYILQLYELTDDNPFYFSNKADSLLATLWRQPKTEDEKTNYLDFILNIAYHLLQQGQIPASCRWYEQGLNYQQHKKLAYEAEEYIYKPLGNNYVRLGDYDKAVAMQELAIEQSLKKNKPELLASLYSNLAISYFWLANYKAVQLNCNKGLNFINANASVKGLLYNVKADAFYAAGQIDSAAWYNDKALQFFKSAESVGADAGWAVASLQLSAKLLSNKKNYASAVSKLANAEKILQQSFPYSRQRDKAKLLTEKGILFLKAKITDSAIASFIKGIQYFNVSTNGFFPDQTVSDLYFGLAQSFKETDTDKSLQYYQLAVENQYFASQLITSSYNSLLVTNNKEQLQREAVLFFEKMFTKTGNQTYLKHLLWLIELGKGKKLLNETQRSNQWQKDSTGSAMQQLFAELRYDYLLLAETKDAVKKQIIQQRIRVQELQLGLQEDRFSYLLQEPSFETFEKAMNVLLQHSEIVSYCMVHDSVIVVHAQKNKISIHKLPIAILELSIKQLLQTYFNTGASAFGNNPAMYFIAAMQLYKQVFPFEEAQTKKIIISPDAFLHLLPFEALVTSGQQFLGQQKEISYSYSLLQYINKLNTPEESLAVHVITFNQHHLSFPALPNSKTEAAFIKKNCKASVADATQTTIVDFIKTIKQPCVLHIASHAVASDSLNQPYLVLQNKLYLGQLQYITTAAPLVVLTACESAAGNLQMGEGVASIARAFISKGVKGVVASRWKVDDAVAPLLVKEFYTKLKENHSPSKALFEARKKYLSTANHLSAKNPLLWAGFSYSGVEQVIDLKKTQSIQWWWLLLLIAPTLYFFRKRK